MTTTTEKLTVEFDADGACDGYPWHVLDRDGDVLDSFATAAEAEADRDERAAEARVESLREAVEAALADCDDAAVLARALAVLTR